MSGIYFYKEDECIERVSKKTEELDLLAKGDGVEIMKNKIKAGRIFYIEPGDDENLMEFFYILDGEIVFEYEDKNKDIILKSGDYFYVQDIKKILYFEALTDVTMLYVSSQPVFYNLSTEIKKLSDIREKVEEKDMYTHDHGFRLKEYSVKIAEKLHFSRKQFKILYYAALFHDLGKLYVPDEILKKPGRLTKEEFEYIKKHPGDGAALIEKSFLRESAKAILQHHERLDGSGYPNGLKGDEICLDAKIIAVVDTYDAMTSDRPYRKGMDHKVAMEEIKSLIGKHYDEKIVLTFEQILKEESEL